MVEQSIAHRDRLAGCSWRLTEAEVVAPDAAVDSCSMLQLLHYCGLWRTVRDACRTQAIHLARLACDWLFMKLPPDRTFFGRMAIAVSPNPLT